MLICAGGGSATAGGNILGDMHAALCSCSAMASICWLVSCMFAPPFLPPSRRSCSSVKSPHGGATIFARVEAANFLMSKLSSGAHEATVSFARRRV